MAQNDDLKYRIEEKLQNNARLQPSRIEIEVENHKVLLRGTVQSIHVMDLAQKVVVATRGVRGVENKLNVRFPESYTRPTDEAIKRSISGLISTNSEVYLERIDINVTEGKVVLRGSVDQYFKRGIVEHCVKIVGGVVSVTNMLAVIPTRSLSDEAISRSILETLKSNEIADLNGISIAVTAGMVVISGEVPDMNSFDSVEDVVKYTDGVKNIENRLMILK